MEVYDEELKKFVKKQDKRRKTFKTLAEARKWLNKIELQKAEAKEKKVIYKNEGIRLVDVADEFLELKRKQAKKEELPYGRIHDGRHTYITLLLHGIEKDDKSIIAPASFFNAKPLHRSEGVA